ncbi:MAG: hypothetical protein KH128_01445 [Firmicutes bacterium]|nr:hypothetical protein [Bacillota bacterium]
MKGVIIHEKRNKKSGYCDFSCWENAMREWLESRRYLFSEISLLTIESSVF